MPQPEHPAVGDSDLNCTSLACTSAQIPPQQTHRSTLVMSKPNSTMDEATSSSKQASAVPGIPPSSEEHDIPQSQMTRTTHQEPVCRVHDVQPPATSSTTSLGESPSSNLETCDNAASKQSSKRSRAEGDDEDNTSPQSKKPAREVEIEEAAVETLPIKVNSAALDDSISDADEPVQLEKPKEQSKTRSRPVANRAAATSTRGRACALCKKRKVKCKHRAVKEQTGNEGVALKQQTSPEDKGEVGMASEIMQADAGVQLVASGEATPAVDDEDVVLIEKELPKETKARKKAAPAKPRAPPARTSTRNRKAPERFEDLQEQPPSKAAPAKKGSSKVFDPVYITTNSTSRLGKADMYHMLTDDDTAWTSLSAEQQATLVAMLPDSSETQQLLAKIQAGDTHDTRPQYLKASDVFRTEVAKFQADLKNGHLAKTWHTAAEQAVAERAAGEYDAWKAEEAELWWGQKGR
ncbi:hypothetical protein OPT61_g3257 [Boeremia exigua]|uniref:Uncharacterized protein n=1 Tax=Boeremia exigua TaxID=749465 RepID=A0ACC2IIL3_9PLEO|nr:hypothetical protein OPT61_g3257 [Boeremia exigua]